MQSYTRSAFVVWAIIVTESVLGQAPLSTAITYQGRLRKGSVSVNGPVDMKFTLYGDANTCGAGGTAIAGPLVFDGQGANPAPVTVSGRLFNVPLDFGAAAFDGSDRWVEIAVRIPHDATNAAPYVTLCPRQPLTAAPYSLRTRYVDNRELTDHVELGSTTPSNGGDLKAFNDVGTNTITLDGSNAGSGSMSGAALINTANGLAAVRIEGSGTETGISGLGVLVRGHHSTFDQGLMALFNGQVPNLDTIVLDANYAGRGGHFCMNNNVSQTVEIYANDAVQADGGSLVRLKNGQSPNRETVLIDARAAADGGEIRLANGGSVLNETTIAIQANDGDGGSRIAMHNGQPAGNREVIRLDTLAVPQPNHPACGVWIIRINLQHNIGRTIHESGVGH